jgi:hypothetical protein
VVCRIHTSALTVGAPFPPAVSVISRIATMVSSLAQVRDRCSLGPVVPYRRSPAILVRLVTSHY